MKRILAPGTLAALAAAFTLMPAARAEEKGAPANAKEAAAEKREQAEKKNAEAAARAEELKAKMQGKLEEMKARAAEIQVRAAEVQAQAAEVVGGAVQVVPGGNVRVQVQGGAIQVQGGGVIQLQGGIQLQGAGGQFQLQLNNGAIQIGGRAVAGASSETKGPSMIFSPAFPFHPLPNPVTWKLAKAGYLGVQLDGLLAEEGAVPQAADAKKEGVVVADVVEESPAAKAGVKPGDRVMKIDGREVGSAKELRDLIKASRAGSIVKLAMKRGDKDIELKAELAPNPADIAAANEAAANVQFANRAQAVPGVVTFSRSVNTGRTTTATAGPEKDTVRLRDGNRFTGKIQRFDPERGLIFERTGAATLELMEDGIQNIVFAERAKGVKRESKAMLQLLDGSWFSGESLTMEGEKIALALSGTERLEFPLSQAQSLMLSDGTAAQVYEGPGGIGGWSSGRFAQGSWEYEDGWLRCANNGAIGRNFERMPDPMDLSFEVNYPPQIQHFSLVLFSTGINQTGTGTLTLQFGPNQITANHFDGRRYNQYQAEIPQANFDGAMKPETRRFRVLVDRIEGRVLVFTGGEKRAEWKISKVNPADMAKTGGHLTVSPHAFTSDHKFGLGRIRMVPWDGKDPGKDGGASELKSDRVLSSARTTTDGKVVRITDGEVQVEGSAPVKREGTLFVRFAPPQKRPELPKSAGTLRLRNGSEFAITSVKGDGETLTVTTRFGSQFTLPLSSYEEMSLFPRATDTKDPTKDLDVLTLTDATQLKGTLVTPVTGAKTLWKIAASREPLAFEEKEVAGVYLSQTRKPADAPALSGSAILRLANGDWLPGEIVALDDKRVVVKNNLAPDLAFPASALRGIFLSQDVIASIADGSTGRELWHRARLRNANFGWPMNTSSQSGALGRSDSPWVYHDGSYIQAGSRKSSSSGALARKWPAYAGTYAIRFEIENQNRNGSFNLQLFNSKEEQTFSLYSSGGRLNAYYNGRSSDGNNLGGMRRFQFEEKSIATSPKMEITLAFDRSTRALRAFVNGKEAGKIVFKPDIVRTAFDVAGISITPMFGSTTGPASRLKNIWIGPWEDPAPVAPPAGEAAKAGAAEEKPAASAAPAPVVHLVNGDEFAGRILGFSADELKADSDAGPLDLPRDRVSWVRFPGAAPKDGGHYPRIRFNDRGVLSVKNLTIGEDRVKCATLEGQSLDFPLSVVKELVFRPVP